MTPYPEVVLHVDQEWEVDRRKNLFLIQGVLHLFELDHLLLVQDLHGMEALAPLVLHQHHTAERAGAQGLHSVKVSQNRGALGSKIKQGCL